MPRLLHDPGRRRAVQETRRACEEGTPEGGGERHRGPLAGGTVRSIERPSSETEAAGQAPAVRRAERW